MRLSIPAGVLALALASCGGAPAPTPAGLLAIRDALAARGVRIMSAVSGDSACPGQPLADNAVHLRLTTAGDVEARDVYVYLFRPREFEATAAQIAACEDEYGATLGGVAPDRLDAAPYRALGADWSDELRRAVEGALRAAAGEG